MLNEIKEFRQYTFPVRETFRQAAQSGTLDPAAVRLRYRTLTNDFAGIPRAMTVVARGLLFAKKDSFPGDSLPNGVFTRTYGALKNWFGAGEGFLGEPFGWLPSYVAFGLLWERLYETCPKGEDPRGYAEAYQKTADCIAALFSSGYLTLSERGQAGRNAILVPLLAQKRSPDSALQKAADIALTLLGNAALGSSYARRRKNYETSIMEETAWTNRAGERAGDHNRGSYDRFIAEALDAGPLKDYVLLAREDVWEHTWLKAGKKKIRLSEKDTAQGRNAAAKDAILKIAASILLAQKRFDDSPHPDVAPPDYVPFAAADLQNWIGGDRAIEDGRYFCGEKGERPLFPRLYTDSGAAFGIRMDDAWLSGSGLEVIEASELPAHAGREGLVYYADEEGLVPLICHPL